MKKKKRVIDFTFSQIGAFASLLVLAIWGVIVLGVNLVTVSGAMDIEITYFGTMVIMLCVLGLFYWKRFRWSYVYGIGLIIFGFFGGLLLAAWNRIFYFSVSVYNLSIILFYIIAVVCTYFSYRSYQELTRLPTKKMLGGISGTVLITVVVGAVLWSNFSLIYDHMFETNLQTIDDQLQNLPTLDDKIQYLMREGNIPSLVAGIVVNDSLVWSRGYGGASQDTVYLIASITKPFVATAVLQLYERNLIDLDDDVNKHLPFTMRHPRYPDTAITIRMLLSHRSGLAHYTNQYSGYVEADEILDWLSANRGLSIVKHVPYPSFAEFLDGYLTPNGPYYSPSAWTVSEPGTAYFYSSPGYDILGYVVESVTNQPFVDYLQENILNPLNMTGTGFSVSDSPNNQAIPRERVFGVLAKTNIELPLYDRNRIGGGGVRSTVPDLAQFLVAHMNHGQINGFQLLKPETVELMHKSTVSFPPQSLTVGYGLGWMHLSNVTYEHHYFHGAQGHGGETWGFRCHMWFVEQEEGAYGVILMTNINTNFKLDSIYTQAMSLKLQDVLLQEASVMFLQTPQD
ncbi:MAG: beta-lactamase family protein [Candidatus Bathyarchaeota archaeon]|nr:beta-lactamase family protein [Candidatus Bathyarchaeota archaeon]MDH5746033.1 beta-lactamase family protein [Candidatus Bathyarchaeota archaeon]